jgi:transcriptional regulator with XRE-family HTH domain
MNYNREHLAALLAQAKLTNSDFARLMGVSRVTVYNWLKDGSPHSLIQAKYAKVVAAVQSAAEAGALPVVSRRVSDRQRLIAAAVRQHLNG